MTPTVTPAPGTTRLRHPMWDAAGGPSECETARGPEGWPLHCACGAYQIAQWGQAVGMTLAQRARAVAARLGACPVCGRRFPLTVQGRVPGHRMWRPTRPRAVQEEGECPGSWHRA